jgi:hypothetical protein
MGQGFAGFDDGRVQDLALTATGELLAAGMFDTADGAPANRVARWDGTAWSALGEGITGGGPGADPAQNPGYVNGLLVQPSGDILAGGSFSQAGSVTAINLAIFSCPVIACPADLDNGSGNGVPDGGVDINDLLYFLVQFEAGAVVVDLDNGTGTGTPDGGVDINDLLYFLVHFEAGC